MSILQSIATVFLTMALVTMANKVASLDFNFTQFLFVIFYLFVRVKIYLDDMCYYKRLLDVSGSDTKVQINARFEVLMFILGICFWFLWVVTITFLKQNSISFACYILAGTIFLGEIILRVINYFGSSHNPINECKIWRFSNWLYIASLLLAGYLDNQYSWIFLLGGIASVFIDFYKSNTMDNIISVVGLSCKQQ